MEIQSTINYSQFKTVKGNRGIYKPHLLRLISSIERNNILPENPIIVNDKMEVIDGQHRLEAAKTLAFPIFYVVKEGARLNEVQLLNANNRQWLTYDYLLSHIAQGKKEYIDLKELADEYRLSVPLAIRILDGRFDDNVVRDFRDGKLTIKNREQSESLASLVSEVRKHTPDNCWSHIRCVEALSRLNVQMNPRLFLEALDRYQQVITRRMSVKDYLRQFENILNAGGKTTITLK